MNTFSSVELEYLKMVFKQFRKIPHILCEITLLILHKLQTVRKNSTVTRAVSLVFLMLTINTIWVYIGTALNACIQSIFTESISVTYGREKT